MEEALLNAMLSSNVEALDALLADDLLFTDHTGRVVDKATDLEAHRSGIINIDALKPSEQLIRDYGNVVYVSVLLSISGTFAGQPACGNFRFSRIWKRTAQSWQVVAGHSTLVLP